jgi:hypothetical protein
MTKPCVSIFASAVRPKLWDSCLSSFASTSCSFEVVFGGFNTPEEFQKAIDSLDINQIATLLTSKRFTVRDVEILLLKMARHRYYKNKYISEGLEWNTNSFVSVLEYSEGSVKDDTTGELIIGDDQYIKELRGEAKSGGQQELTFGDAVFDPDSFKTKSPFEEVNKHKK